jgi:hypothetical protein
MPMFVDGDTTVVDARNAGLEDAIERVTGVSPATIRVKPRNGG